jgi:hypothetical protein
MKTYKVLSIDAWGNEEDGYEWNQWFNAGTIDLVSIDDDDLVLNEMHHQGFITAVEGCDIEDDQYNLVVVDKATREPLFAVEYGSTT